MSAAPGFFRSEAVRALLARASRAAGLPIALHFVKGAAEGPRILGFGGCAACAQAAALPGGNAACRASREAIAAIALRQHRPLAGVCHLGFGVLCVPALPGEGYMLALGPFAPAGGDASLEHDARAGIAVLSGASPADIAVPLDDIHRVPPGSVSAIADWVTEELARLWDAWPKDAPGEEEAVEGAPAALGGKAPRPQISIAQDLATAIAGSHRRRVRAILRAASDEALARAARGQERTQVAACLLALLNGALAACARAGLDTAPAMALLPDAAMALPRLEAPQAVAAASRALAPLLRAPITRNTRAAAGYRALDRLIAARLPESLSLAEAALALGKSPAAISQYLQRHYGMNYSEYQGRQRVERAKELLRATQLSATAIALRTGISDQSNFAKLFKRHTGLSPLAYRRQHGSKPQT